jgi:LysM repeat protein
MRSTIQALLAGAALLAAPAMANADVAHTVRPGESLWSVAAQDGLTVDQLAAANGISSSAGLQAGTTLMIPPQSAAPQAVVSSSAPADSSPSVVSSAPATGGGSYVVQPGDTLSGIAAASGMTVDELAAANGLDPSGLLLAGTRLNLSGSSSGAGTPASDGGSVSSAPGTSGGSYVVQPGDTLWGIATANGMTVDELAAANGLDPRGLLLAGTRLNISGASAASAPAPVGAPASSAAPSGAAQPTPEAVSPADVGQVAAANGVSSSLAEAIADQESGFNNNAVSSTGAVGVMQIEPYTWTFIGQNLAPTPPLSPNSAQDNIRGGVLLLRSLLDQTGGDPGLAAAGYFQGLESVREHGLLPSTRRYVANVLALRQRFGGP